MAEYQTNLKDNWMVNFINGKKDTNQDWDEYIKAMNKSGLKGCSRKPRLTTSPPPSHPIKIAGQPG